MATTIMHRDWASFPTRDGSRNLYEPNAWKPFIGSVMPFRPGRERLWEEFGEPFPLSLPEPTSAEVQQLTRYVRDMIGDLRAIALEQRHHGDETAAAQTDRDIRRLREHLMAYSVWMPGASAVPPRPDCLTRRIAVRLAEQQRAALEVGERVDLSLFRNRQRFVETLWRTDASVRSDITEDMQMEGTLQPKPHRHWVTDRSEAAHDRRTGVPLRALLQKFPAKNMQGVFVDLGSGNGACRDELSSVCRQAGYQSVGVTLAAHYPLTPLIARLVNFDALQRDIGIVLPEEERDLLCDFLACLVMAKDGQVEQDEFPRDAATLQELGRDVRSIAAILCRKAIHLPLTRCIPTVESIHQDGEVRYPRKIEAPHTESFAAAAFRLSLGMSKYLRRADPLEQVPAYLPGTVISDFQELEKLRDGSVDLMRSVRGTVYIRGDDYVRMMLILARKLRGDGIAVFDCVRDNDGWRYRLGEWLRIARVLAEADPDMRLSVVVGPPFPGEDHCQSRAVPLSIVMSRNPAAHIYSASVLPARDPESGVGYALMPLEHYCSDDGDLALLDAEGGVLNDVRASRSPRTRQ